MRLLTRRGGLRGASQAARMSYIGTRAPNEEQAQIGEAGVEQKFRKDPYGCGSELSQKRHSRDPFARGVRGHARLSHPQLAAC